MLCPLLCDAARSVLGCAFWAKIFCFAEEEANPEQGVSICHWFRCHTGSEVDGKRVTMLTGKADRPESAPLCFF